MATKKKTKKEGVAVEKAESSAPLPVGSLLSTERGQPRIATSSFFLQDQKRRELAMPTRLCTFDAMAEDAAVHTSIDITNIHVTDSLYNGSFQGKTPKAKKAAEFLNYCIRNIAHGNWYEVCLNAATDLKYGWSFGNIVTEKRSYGQYSGARCLKKIAPRSQKSVFGWLWDKNFREVQGFVQKPPLEQTRKWNMGTDSWKEGISALSTGKFYESKYPIIRTEQLLWFKYNGVDGNPQGDSPLLHCYNDWKEKELVSRYEVVGVSKDLGGAVVLRVPDDLLERAQDSGTYPNDAAALSALQSNAQKLHAGESSYILLSSAVDETTKTPLYDFKLQGIEGGGKQYNTNDIITRKNKGIYNTFGTSYLLLGQDGVGSNALASTAEGTHLSYVRRNILQKKVVIDTQLIPRLLKVNDIELNWADMPEFVPANPSKLDLETLGKFIQRAKSVGGLTPEAMEYLYNETGLPTEGLDLLDFTPEDTSRAGESKGSSGTGDTQAGGKASATNSDNGGVDKAFVIDGGRVIDPETDKVLNTEDLDEDGNYK
jgi:hypothetical protein